MRIFFFLLITVSGYTQQSHFVALNRVTSASSFSPSDLSGLVLWFKADAITGKVNNDTMGIWLDNSGLLNNATQTTASQKPTYQTNIVNSKPIVRFDGTDDYLHLSSSIYDASFSYFVVMKKASSGGIGNALCTDVSGSQPFAVLMYSNGNTYFGNRSGGWHVTDNNTSFNYWTNITASGGTPSIFKNGSVQTLSSDGGGTSNSWDVISRRGSSEYGAEDIAEIILYNTALSSTNYGKIHTYLAAKYGL